MMCDKYIGLFLLAVSTYDTADARRHNGVSGDVAVNSTTSSIRMSIRAVSDAGLRRPIPTTEDRPNITEERRLQDDNSDTAKRRFHAARLIKARRHRNRKSGWSNSVYHSFVVQYLAGTSCVYFVIKIPVKIEQYDYNVVKRSRDTVVNTYCIHLHVEYNTWNMSWNSQPSQYAVGAIRDGQMEGWLW